MVYQDFLNDFRYVKEYLLKYNCQVLKIYLTPIDDCIIELITTITSGLNITPFNYFIITSLKEHQDAWHNNNEKFPEIIFEKFEDIEPEMLFTKLSTYKLLR